MPTQHIFRTSQSTSNSAAALKPGADDLNCADVMAETAAEQKQIRMEAGYHHRQHQRQHQPQPQPHQPQPQPQPQPQQPQPQPQPQPRGMMVDNRLAVFREQLGQCGGCASQTYDIVRNQHGVEISRTAKTIPGSVINGRCLYCCGGALPVYEYSAESSALVSPVPSHGDRVAALTHPRHQHDEAEEEVAAAAAAAARSGNDSSEAPQQVYESKANETTTTPQPQSEIHHHQRSINHDEDDEDRKLPALSSSKSNDGIVSSSAQSHGENFYSNSFPDGSSPRLDEFRESPPPIETGNKNENDQRDSQSGKRKRNNITGTVDQHPPEASDGGVTSNKESDISDLSPSMGKLRRSTRSGPQKATRGTELCSPERKLADSGASNEAEAVQEKETENMVEHRALRRHTRSRNGEATSSANEKAGGASYNSKNGKGVAAAGGKTNGGSNKSSERRRSKSRDGKKPALTTEEKIQQTIQVASLLVNKGDKEIQMEFLTSLYDLCQDYEQGRLIVKAGGVRAILAAMSTFSKCVDVQTSGCAVLISVVFYAQHHLVYRARISRRAINAMKADDRDADLHVQAIGVLQQLVATDAGLAHDLVQTKSDCLSQVLMSMKTFSSSRNVQDAACLFLQNLTSELSFRDSMSVLESEALVCVVSVLRKYQREYNLLGSALGAIGNMFRHEHTSDELKHKFMIADGFIDILLSLMASSSSKVVCGACVVVNNMCVSTEALGVNRAITDAGFISRTEEAMRRFPTDAELQQCCCLFLRTLSYGDVKTRGLKIAQDGASERVIYCLHKYVKNISVLSEAMGALRNVAHPTSQSVPDTVSLILNAMVFHQNDEEIQEHGSQLLLQYIEDPDAIKLIKEQKGQAVISRAASTFPATCSAVVESINSRLGEAS